MATDRYQRLPGVALPRVIGPRQESRAFGEAGVEVTGQPLRLARSERIAPIGRVTGPDQPAAGVLRQATEADRPIVRAWIHAFIDDACGHVGSDDVDRIFRSRLSATTEACYYCELMGRPVSLVGWSGRTPNGFRIGPV